MHIKKQLESALGFELEHPELEEHGDYSSNIALKMKGGRKMAEEMAGKIKRDDLVEKVEVAGAGFLNIWLQTGCLISELQRVLTEGNDYGKGDLGVGKTVVVDYSAPNIAKRFGIGHLRSTIIGQALYNLYAFLGYKTIGDNHLGDWGTQFGKLLYMIDQNPGVNFDIDKLEEWYVEFHKHEEWEEYGRYWFKKLEDKDPIARGYWEKCIEISMHEFERIYRLLGVHIDYSYGESFYQDMMSDVVADAKNKNLAVTSEGALVVNIENSKIPLMLLKSDRGTTYATRDLATLKFRYDTWNPDLVIYEVGNEQTFHFQQIFEVAKKLGYVKPDAQLIHTKHGLYLNPDGKKFSTRKGDTVKLDEVLGEAIERATQLGSADTAELVGVGAVKYFDLAHNPQSDIVFDWDMIMALDGNSGPYLQYTAARIHSVLNRAQLPITNYQLPMNISISQLSNEEMRILRYFYRFPEVVEEAAKRFSPNLLANFLYELASRYNAFYNQHSILSADNVEVKNFRLLLSAGVGQILKNGLGILGIQVPEKM